jgi:ATP-dependent RNA helicase DDX18/HAS1
MRPILPQAAGARTPPSAPPAPRAVVGRAPPSARGGAPRPPRAVSDYEAEESAAPAPLVRNARPAKGAPKRRAGPPPPSAAEVPLLRVGSGDTSSFYARESWSEAGADAALADALASLGFARPSNIQAAAFKALASDAAHVALADQAGSGKTLAYLAPLVQALKARERATGQRAAPRRPRVVVVVPTAELAAQVVRVCRALSAASPEMRFGAAAFTGGRPLRPQREALAQGLDVAVGTPGRLAELAAAGALDLSAAAAVVCDEVDVLLGDASLFAAQLAPLRAAAPAATRFVLVTATLPAAEYARLERAFPGLAAALGPGLHRAAPGVTQHVVDCSGGAEVSEETGRARKAAALLAAAQERRAPRTIVFCNKIDSCRFVENFLNRALAAGDAGVAVLPYHAGVAEERRGANLRRFLAPPRRRAPAATPPPPPPPPREGGAFDSDFGAPPPPAEPAPPPAERLLLVCTDRASRGVDSTFVDHVVLFDFPRDPSEFVRRVGRTGRGAGGRGLVTVLALGRQVGLAREVSDRTRKGLPVHKLPAAMPAAGGVAGGVAARAATAAAAAPPPEPIDWSDDIGGGPPPLQLF